MGPYFWGRGLKAGRDQKGSGQRGGGEGNYAKEMTSTRGPYQPPEKGKKKREEKRGKVEKKEAVSEHNRRDPVKGKGMKSKRGEKNLKKL